MNLISVFTLFLPMFPSGIISYLFPIDRSWYNSLNQSSLTPPNAVFGYVWFALYLLIGYGLGLPNSEWLWLNFALSMLWLIIYNGQKDITGGFWILFSMILTLLVHLQRTNQWFLIPYLAWLCLATYLNYYIMTNN